MTLACPWSAPRLPFSRTVRPNSDIVTSVTSATREPRSRAKAAIASLNDLGSRKQGSIALRRFVDPLRPERVVSAAKAGQQQSFLRRYTDEMGTGTEEILRDFFAKSASEIVAVYLFGSEARGTAGADSDVDVAVLYGQKPPAAIGSADQILEGNLERLLGRPVEVVLLNSSPADLVHRVLRDGRLLFEGSRPARLSFEVQSRNEYFDLLPILRRYRKREPAAS